MPCKHKALSKQRWSQSQKAEVDALKRQKCQGHLEHLQDQAKKRYLPYIQPWSNKLNAEACILDVGCGAICLGNTIAAKENFFIDPLLDFYRREFPGALPDLSDTYMLCDEAEHMRFSNQSFDLILCLRTISHLYNPELALHELERVLKDDGILLCSVVVWPVWMSRLYYRCCRWLPKRWLSHRLYCYSARGIRNTLQRHFHLEVETTLSKEHWYSPSKELLFICSRLR